MKKTTFLIVGKHTVLEALKNPSRKIERVFLTEDAQKKLNRENQSLNLFKSSIEWWRGKDSNLRRPKSTGLQPAPFDRFGTPPNK